MTHPTRLRTLLKAALLAVLGCAATARADLVWYSPMDGNADPASGSGTVPTAVGAPAATTDRHGAAQGAVAFDGDDAYDLGKPVASFTAATVACWVRYDATDSLERGPVAVGGSKSWTTDDYFTILRSAGTAGATAAFRTDLCIDGRREIVGPAIGVGDWHHLAMSFRAEGDDTVHAFYVDGVKAEKTYADLEAVLTPVNNWLIGAERIGSRHWIGAIDDVAIWDVALTDEQILSLATGGCLPLQLVPGPVPDPTLLVLRTSTQQFYQPFSGYHGAVGRNLLLNPDFELGATGWRYICTWPNTTEDYLKTERSRPSAITAGLGVEGGDCLQLGAPSSAVASYCVPVEQGRTYTVSLMAKAAPGNATGDLSVLMLDPDWQIPLWKKISSVPDTWTQYTWTFVWDRTCQQRRAYVNLGSSTGLLVDRVLVTEGDSGDYEAPVMAGLAFARAPYFVRGRDAAAGVLRIAPGTRTTGRAQIVTLARDAWGEEIWRRTDSVSLDSRTEISIALPTHRLGNFHVATIAVQEGEVVGRGVSRYTVLDPPAGMTQTRGRPGVFGICQSAFAWPSWANALYAPVLVDTGVQFNRFFAKSREGLTYPFPAEYIEGLQRRAAPLAAAGIALMACVQTFPGMDQVGWLSRDPTPEELAAYERGLHDYVTALTPAIQYWEIFNEPDLWMAEDGQRAFTPEKYAIIQESAFATIKAIDTNLTVVCNALNTFRWSWMDDWFAAGGVDNMDSFSFHPYRSHPDQLNDVGVYNDLLTARDKLDDFGGQALGMINSEQLYGVNLFYTGIESGEASRGYYVDTHHELEAASRTVRNLVHHAAAGVTCCPFTFRGDFAALGPGPDGMLVYDMLPAYNAATRFLADAGTGNPLPLGLDLRVFLFPDAAGGPLAVVWTPLADAVGTMALAGNYTVHDIMGNPRPEMAAARQLRIATDPVYLRFASGTPATTLEAAFATSRTTGLSAPVSLDALVTEAGTLTVHVQNRINLPVSGTVELTRWPAAWVPATTTASFPTLAAGAATILTFAFPTMAMEADGAYEIALSATTPEGAATRAQTLRPFFFEAATLLPDGSPDWSAVEAMALGDDHVSIAFSDTLTRTGDADLSADLSVVWTPDALEVRVAVTDDAHVPAADYTQLYLGDSLQLYFDPFNDASPEAANTADDIEYVFARQADGTVRAWLENGAEGNYKGEANQEDKLLDPDVDVAITRTGTTTLYRVTLPRATCLPGIDFAPGSSFGFSLLINDNDGLGRKTGLTLSPKGTEPYGAPADYRDAVPTP